MRSHWRIAALLGAAFFAAALLSPPVDRLAGDSFSWHMVQHVLLFFAVPLLALIAGPFELFARIASKDAVAQAVRIARRLHVIAHPVVTGSFVVATLWITHFSPLYESALDNGFAHACEHALYLGAGLAFWLPILAPAPLRPLGFPARLLYVLILMPQGAFLGLALFSATEPLYPHYALVGSAARALADQKDAAAIMWIGMGLIALCSFLATLASWAAREIRAETAS